LGGKRDGPCHQLARLPQRDVYGPVLTAEFGELARAVQRVDDPHPVGTEPSRIGLLFFGGLFGEHRVIGASCSKGFHQIFVSAPVSSVLSLGAGGLRELGAHAEQ
jgi:hypothetical protein